MINNQKVIVVFPAYNASKTLSKTYNEIPFDLVDEIILVDDSSYDNTLEIANNLGIKNIIKHERNLGYGANQKTCYKKALDLGGEIIVMLHPDYQYTPKLLPSMVHIVASGLYPVVFGSRILGKGALKGGMPKYKYYANRVLTLLQNILLNQKLSEYHTGYRAFSSRVLKCINFTSNSDDFIFDNEMIAQILFAGFEIAEITCPTRYDEESSSINLSRSIRYGVGVIKVSLMYAIQKLGIYKYALFKFNQEARHLLV